MKTQGLIRLLVVLFLVAILFGCGIAAQNIKTNPPGNVNRVDPLIDFKEIKINNQSGRMGSVTIGIVLTMKAGNQRIIAGHPVIVMPYSYGFYEDCLILLQWLSSPSPKPNDVARRRDADLHFKSTVEIYKNKMGKANVFQHVRKTQTKVNGEVEIKHLPAGNYVAISSLRDRYNGIEWAVKFRINRGENTNLLLTNVNGIFIY